MTPKGAGAKPEGWPSHLFEMAYQFLVVVPYWNGAGIVEVSFHHGEQRWRVLEHRDCADTYNEEVI